MKTKEMHSFFWLYLTINAPDFQLIPLDRNTFENIYFQKTKRLLNFVSSSPASVFPFL